MSFNINLLLAIIVISFAAIHFIEVSGYLARLAGVINGSRAMAYSLQNAVYMMTRFFTMALMPVLGLLVDLGVDKKTYLLTVLAALNGALITSLAAIAWRSRILGYFDAVIVSTQHGAGLLRSMLNNLTGREKNAIQTQIPKARDLIKSKIFWLAAVIFCTYSLSIFIVFLISLYLPQYRAFITQLSGITNAFATILLTFYIEPKISVAIDKNDNPTEIITALLIGRIAGIGIVSQAITITLLISIS